MGIKEVRVHLCQKSAASAGAREFVEKLYVPLKLANPKFPLLIRECGGMIPRHGEDWVMEERSVSTSPTRVQMKSTLPLLFSRAVELGGRNIVLSFVANPSDIHAEI